MGRVAAVWGNATEIRFVTITMSVETANIATANFGRPPLSGHVQVRPAFSLVPSMGTVVQDPTAMNDIAIVAPWLIHAI